LYRREILANRPELNDFSFFEKPFSNASSAQLFRCAKRAKQTDSHVPSRPDMTQRLDAKRAGAPRAEIPWRLMGIGLALCRRLRLE
jgi:hypothetical protein